MTKEEFKTKWLEALRSGRYKQGEMYLRDADDQYCCLGVALDIIDPDGWHKYPAVYGHRLQENVGGLTSEYIGDETAKPLGLNDDPREAILVGTMQNTLSSMNDQGCSFKDIANFIEENL